jgi:hypothetical protein
MEPADAIAPTAEPVEATAASVEPAAETPDQPVLSAEVSAMADKPVEPILPNPATPSISNQPTVFAARPAIAAEPAQPVEPIPAAPVPSQASIQGMTPNDERTWAMLSHLSVLLNLVTGFGGPIAALVIYLVYKERSRYVAYHALQSLIFQLITWVGGGILTAIAWTVSGALTAIFIGLLCMPFACALSLLPLGSIVYGIVGGIQANQGQDFKYWLVGDWVRGTLTGK